MHLLAVILRTSQCHGKGKKSAAWKAYEEATMTFANNTEQLFHRLTLQSQWFGILEHFTCVFCDKGSTLSHVNELRQEMLKRLQVCDTYISAL